MVGLSISKMRHGVITSTMENGRKKKSFRFNIDKKQQSVLSFLMTYTKNDIKVNNDGITTVVIESDIEDIKEAKQVGDSIIKELLGDKVKANYIMKGV